MYSYHTPLLITFDFDGTLYPLRPYDSEQRLLLKATKQAGTLKRAIAKRSVLKDMRGMMHLGEFTDNYVKFTRDAPEGMLDEVVDELCALVEPDALEPLRELYETTEAEFCVISCGTVNLIERYLTRMGVRDAFGDITGKVFDTAEGRLALDKITVKTPQDKVQVLDDAIGRIAATTGVRPKTVAVGDGPTDIPMLRHADFGILIDWDKRPTDPSTKNGFPYAGSIREVRDIVLRWLHDGKQGTKQIPPDGTRDSTAHPNS